MSFAFRTKRVAAIIGMAMIVAAFLLFKISLRAYPDWLAISRTIESLNVQYTVIETRSGAPGGSSLSGGARNLYLLRHLMQRQPLTSLRATEYVITDGTNFLVAAFTFANRQVIEAVVFDCASGKIYARGWVQEIEKRNPGLRFRTSECSNQLGRFKVSLQLNREQAHN